ncbi:MAG: hypothetical protein OQL19_18420 [Gammaproteobacteria bacterium]|nr:hypothetical protein [Gammaproteobacteria bacterium]
MMSKKIEEANNRLKHCLELSEFSEKKDHWIWIDFHDEDRFLYQIIDELEINIIESSVDDLVLFAMKKLGINEQIYIDKFVLY